MGVISINETMTPEECKSEMAYLRSKFKVFDNYIVEMIECNDKELFDSKVSDFLSEYRENLIEVNNVISSTIPETVKKVAYQLRDHMAATLQNIANIKHLCF